MKNSTLQIIVWVGCFVFCIVAIGSAIWANIYYNERIQSQQGEIVVTENQSPNFKDQNISIVKVGKCQYVLWYNGYGSDMEHYGACEHCENK